MNKQKFTRLFVLVLSLFSGTLIAQDCTLISMQSADNQLNIEGLSAPNSIIKVFDDNWQLFFECNNDCGDTLIFSDLPLGDVFHLDAQLYDDNWQFICAKTLDKQIGSDAETCPDAICDGNITFTSQAEIDAFCGCEEIGGQLTIGNNSSNNFSDITSLANLSQLKRVQGALLIRNNAYLNGLEGLEKIERVGSLSIVNNPDLSSLDALSSLNSMEFGISLRDCPILADIDIFEQLTFVRTISIFNTPIKNLKPFANIENNYLSGLNLTECERLTSLEGLEGIQSIDGFSFNFLTINKNPILTDISALSNLSLVNGNFTIQDNPALSDCCGIANLLDDDESNGNVVGQTVVSRNLVGCSSPFEIVENCEVGSGTSCDGLRVNSADNQLIIDNMLAPKANIKVYDATFQLVFNCSGDCPSTIVVPNLNKCENYSYDIQLFTEQYEHICSRTGSLRVIGQSSETSVCTGDIQLETQAQVDEFCGCDKIEGSLSIGTRLPNTLSDITDISNLGTIKEVTSFIEIRNTQIREIANLNVEKIGGSYNINSNPNLQRVVGPSSLNSDVFFRASFNPQLIEVAGFDNVKEMSGIAINTNANLINLTAFQQLERINFLTIGNNSQLRGIPFLQGINSINQSLNIFGNNVLQGILIPNLVKVNAINISRNNNLNALQASENLDSIILLTVLQNPNLNDCCIFKNLVDGDLSNGEVMNVIRIEDNATNCNSVAAILENCNDPAPTGCEIIDIQSENNQLIISGITAENAVVKVFDNDWQFAFSCSANCEETIVLENLTAGDIYHTDIQFYDANWQFICEDKQDVEIQGDGNPCVTNCQGLIQLRTQAEVDAFCGCEVVEGDLVLGGVRVDNGVVTPMPDITDISKLGSLKKVTGNLAILNTLLVDVQPLSELLEVGNTLVMNNNPSLESLAGLEQLEIIGNELILEINNQLRNLDNLPNLQSIQGLVINGESVESIAQLSNVDIKNLQRLSVINCEKLVSLEGLEGLETISGNGGITIATNEVLQDLTALQNVTLVTGSFVIAQNPILDDCCAVAHLLDEDDTNGMIDGSITINENPSFCSSTEEILANCDQNTEFSCDNIQINYTDNNLTISGLTAPIEIIKVFDKDWNKLFDCFADCEETITIPNVNSSIFRIQIATYDEDWNFICHGDQDFVPAESRTLDQLVAEDFTLSPNPALEATFLNLQKLEGEEVDLKLFDQIGQEVYQKTIQKVRQPTEKIDLSPFSNGLYILQIQPKGKRMVSKKLVINRLY